MTVCLQPNIRATVCRVVAAFLHLLFVPEDSLDLFRIENLSVDLLSQVDRIESVLQHFCMHLEGAKSPKDSLQNLKVYLFFAFLPPPSDNVLIMPILLILPISDNKRQY